MRWSHMVTAEENCFQKSFKAIKTGRISNVIWQLGRASVVKSLTAIRRQRGTVRRFRLADS